MNSLKIAAALRALADAFETPAEAADLPPAQPAEAAAPAKRGRGRPAKGEETAAPAASAPVQASSTTSPTSAAAEADPFSPAGPPAATLDEVRTALTNLKAAATQDIALAVLKSAGGADNLTGLSADKYGLVVAAAKAKQAEYEKAPAPTPDPFEVPAGTPTTAPETKPVTLEEVKGLIVATQKRTSTDAVQKVVMDHGGKASIAGGGVQPSLKALPADKYAATIKALQALPTTK